MNIQKYTLKAGNLKNLKLINFDLSSPSENEVQVQISAIGLNFADIFAIWGLYSATPKGEFTPGLEYSGKVIALGSGVQDFKLGDRVMGVTRFGAYATALNIDQRYLIKVPKDWSDEEGAAYLVQVLTAYYGLKNLGNIQEGYNVLIHSAAGGVGIWANRIAKHYKANTFGTVGSLNKIDFCKKEGYDHVLVRSNSFREDLEVLFKDKELNLIMECIGGEVLKAGYDQLAEEGRLIIYGSARYASRSDKPNYTKMMYQFFTRPKIDPQKMIELNKGILGFNLIYLYEKASLMRKLLNELEPMQLGKPIVGHRFSFEDLPDAVREFQTGQTKGKVLVKVTS